MCGSRRASAACRSSSQVPQEPDLRRRSGRGEYLRRVVARVSVLTDHAPGRVESGLPRCGRAGEGRARGVVNIPAVAQEVEQVDPRCQVGGKGPERQIAPAVRVGAPPRGHGTICHLAEGNAVVIPDEVMTGRAGPVRHTAGESAELPGDRDRVVDHRRDIPPRVGSGDRQVGRRDLAQQTAPGIQDHAKSMHGGVVAHILNGTAARTPPQHGKQLSFQTGS